MYRFLLAMFFILAGPVLSVANVQLPQGEFAYAEWNGENNYQPVTDIIRGEKVYEMVLITLKSGELIQATDEHPLYVQSQGWRDAKLLKKGDRLYLQGKGSVRIASIKRETRQEKVYNLTVARNHTYYVGRDGVLVHNAGCVSKEVDDLFKAGRTPKASELKNFAEQQGWKPSQTANGPLKYIEVEIRDIHCLK